MEHLPTTFRTEDIDTIVNQIPADKSPGPGGFMSSSSGACSLDFLLQGASSALSATPPSVPSIRPLLRSLHCLRRWGSRCSTTWPSSWPALLFSPLDISPRPLLWVGLVTSASSTSIVHRNRCTQHLLLQPTTAASARCTSITHPGHLLHQTWPGLVLLQSRLHHLLGCLAAPPLLPELHQPLESQPEAANSSVQLCASAGPSSSRAQPAPTAGRVLSN